MLSSTFSAELRAFGVTHFQLFDFHFQIPPAKTKTQKPKSRKVSINKLFILQ